MQRRTTEANAAEPEIRVGPSQIERHAEQRDDEDTGRDGRALEVLHLARFRIGERTGSHVETGEPAHATDDEVAETEHVPPAAHSEGEAEDGGRDAERDDVG